MRYDRQIILPEIGEEGQKKLQEAKVLIVGVGGLGSPIALYLAGAGVGCLGLVDDDLVSITNLQRQVLYSEKELGKPKAICAAERLSALNSEIRIHPYSTRLTKENAYHIIQEYDIVVDGCDNFATRYLINDICIEQKSRRASLIARRFFSSLRTGLSVYIACRGKRWTQSSFERAISQMKGDKRKKYDKRTDEVDQGIQARFDPDTDSGISGSGHGMYHPVCSRSAGQ